MNHQEPTLQCLLCGCLNNTGSGWCEEWLPVTIPKLKPDNKSCYHYEDSIINKKLISELGRKPIVSDDVLTDEQVAKIEKAKKTMQQNMKRKQKELEE
jgi:hypothetical protein